MLGKVLFSRIFTRFTKLFIAITVLHLIFLVHFFRSYGISKGSSISLPVSYNNELDKEAQETLVSKTKERFSKVEENPDRFWLTRTELVHTNVEVPINRYINPSAEDAWDKTNELFYDPRFILSIYLNELKHSLDTSKERPTLPFSWADWIDLTKLNDELSKPMEERMDCDVLRLNTKKKPDTSYFCLNNAELTDDMIQELGFTRREQLPGFVIFQHSTHSHKPFNDFRVLEAKSYALTFLPKPLKVMILTGNNDNGFYEFLVDPNSNGRLATTNMVSKYLQNNNIVDNGAEDYSVTFDHIREYRELIKSHPPSTVSVHHEPVNSFDTIEENKSKNQSTNIVLDRSMFRYSKDQVVDQIHEYESKSATGLSPEEYQYFMGLKMFNDCSAQGDEIRHFKTATIRTDDDKNVDNDNGWHYDWRFFNGALNYDRRGWSKAEMSERTRIILERMIRTWYMFSRKTGIISWIMHGTLLSWYWNGLIFPYDIDIDIQMPVSELIRLAKHYNQTLVVENPEEGYGKYLIDVGTFVHDRDITDLNYIDARFVDVDSGIYIDFTGLSTSKANPPTEYSNTEYTNISKPLNDDTVDIYNDRRKHFYVFDEISPLRYSMLSGSPVLIPNGILTRLKFEYAVGLESMEFNDWFFVPVLRLWLHKNQLIKHLYPNMKESFYKNIDNSKIMKAITSLSKDEIASLLDDDAILTEYYLTRNLTTLHAWERYYLFGIVDNHVPEIKNHENPKDSYNQLTAKFKPIYPIRKNLFEFEHFDRLHHHIADTF
ncbi:Piso0_000020 [Millerozyma farinosa CBS 7064]|uniref:Piso0_000020 protein n=1 Tax=Pichia sorbitophila (strain ATCC MYA-4447 / BCRC 22081 / CBS 7064 / NBRC 10061 / NRRL Y-12695) TaxID=559304 RepID=G8YUB7_PICSO|nr:Piso0_000020 [Millerozyma farinosa CBS 7064]